MGEKPSLDLDTSSIACERPVDSHDAMTRNHERNGVGAVGGTHRSARSWSSNQVSDVPVSRRPSEGNRGDNGPYLLLERTTAKVQGKIEEAAPSREVLANLKGKLGVHSLGGNKARAGKRPGKPPLELPMRTPPDADSGQASPSGGQLQEAHGTRESGHINTFLHTRYLSRNGLNRKRDVSERAGGELAPIRK